MKSQFRPAFLLGCAALLALLPACQSTRQTMNLSPESLRTPPHHMSRSEYPFDDGGAYVDSWAAEGANRFPGARKNSDSDDRPATKPTPKPVAKKPTPKPVAKKPSSSSSAKKSTPPSKKPAPKSSKTSKPATKPKATTTTTTKKKPATSSSSSSTTKKKKTTR